MHFAVVAECVLLVLIMCVFVYFNLSLCESVTCVYFYLLYHMLRCHLESSKVAFYSLPTN